MDPHQVAMRDYVDSRFAAMQSAVDKAEVQLRERLAGMNEFRETLRDQASRLATRESLDLIAQNHDRQIDALMNRIVELEKKQANAEGRAWMLFTLLGVFLTALSIVLRIMFP